MQEKALAGIYCIDTFGTITVRISFGEDKERQIIQRLGRGDASAMDDLYALAADKLAGVCARYISAEADRKDILQESFIKIFTRIGSFDYRGHGSLMAWMTRIVVNESLLWLRQRQRDCFVAAVADVPDDVADDPPDTTVLSEDELLSAVQALPPGYRAVFNLYVVEGKSHQEISRLLHIKPDTSASQLHRAKRLLAANIYQLIRKKQ